MRIDICGYDSPVHNGGPLEWLMRMPEEFRERGLDCRILLFGWAPKDECIAYQYFKANNFQVHFADFQDTHTNVRWLLQQAQNDTPAIFVANHVVPAYYAAGFLKQSGVATVGVIRSDDGFYHGLINQFCSRKNHWAPTAVACVSEFLREQVIRANSLAPNQCRTIPSGAIIPAETAAPKGKKFRALYAGRLCFEQKQALKMVQALHFAKQATPNLEVELIGDGNAVSAIKDYIEQENIDWIKLRGALPTKAVRNAMLSSHCHVLLSDYEGTPMAVMEAMSCGLPPICLSTRSGISDLITSGESGIIVEDREQSFSDAVRQLSQDDALWRKLSTAARAKAETEFSVNACANKWLALFQDIAPPPETIKRPELPKKLRLLAPEPNFKRQDYRLPQGYQWHKSRLYTTLRRIKRKLGT